MNVIVLVFNIILLVIALISIIINIINFKIAEKYKCQIKKLKAENHKLYELISSKRNRSSWQAICYENRARRSYNYKSKFVNKVCSLFSNREEKLYRELEEHMIEAQLVEI